MNGFELLAKSYQSLADRGSITQENADKEIRVFDFLATCDQDDFYRLFNSGAFNDILGSFCHKALTGAEVDEDTQSNVMSELRWLIDTVPAEEIVK